MPNPPDIIIRRMRIEEIDEIQQLYAQQIQADDNPLTAIRITPKQHAWEMRRLRQQLITDQRYMPIVALLGEGKDAQIVGYTAAIIEHQASLFEVQMVASIDELWVVPEHRGRGIGSALMEELFEQIDALGIEWVKVQMPVNNEETRSFFDKIGFVQKTVEMQIHLECNR